MVEDSLANPSLAQSGEVISEETTSFKVPWLDSTGTEPIEQYGEIIVDYQVVERDGAWWAQPTDVRLGEGWITGTHWLESVPLLSDGNVWIKLGQFHKLAEVNYGNVFITDAGVHRNLWGAVIDYQVRMKPAIIKHYMGSPPEIQFELGQGRVVSEGTRIIYPFE